MEETIRRVAGVLGAKGLESVRHDSRFVVEAADGAQLKVSIEGAQQRLMAVLNDKEGVVRMTVDLAPITKVTEDTSTPGRVTLHVGHMLLHLDSKPTLAIELLTHESAPPLPR